jgi:heme-degrading monooxygenase HmoA
MRGVRRQEKFVIAVIFEVKPAEDHRDEYLAIASALRPQLEQIDGFISIERFESLTEPGKLLSLSFFRDEDAVKEWRTLESHRKAQFKGRAGVFEDYRLKVAAVIRDYGMFDRDQAPNDSKLVHENTSDA